MAPSTESIFSSNATRYILAVLSFILLILALGLHSVYAAFNQAAKLNYDDLSVTNDSDFIEALFIPPFIYFIIVGFLQTTIIIITLLFICQNIRPTFNRLTTLKFLLIILLGLNFGIAVFTGMRWPAYRQGFSFILEYDEESSLFSLSDQEREYFNSIQNVYTMTIVECLVTFIVAIPIICVMILTLLLLERNFNKANPKNNQEKEDKYANSASNLNK